ncbi:MAG: SDR family NAD(P)-dependent oxidoreductase [Spirochaetaceae bacterium]|nr:SDR family NAD(P)-dependent oxidoreductase [Spirochaetaceae bacterium]
MRLANKRIIVTGAATGIGRATARLTAAEGARVAALDINDGDARSIVDEICRSGGRARYWHADVRDGGQVATAVSQALDWFGGGVDVLLHLAGILQGAAAELPSFPDAVWDEVIDVNLKGSYLVSKQVAGPMIAAGSGVIVLCSSGAGVTGGSSSFAYGSSKGATHGLSLVLAQRLAPHGIRVHDVCPGSVETPLKVAQLRAVLEQDGDRAGFEREMRSLVPADGVAPVFAFLASDEARYLRGSLFTS